MDMLKKEGKICNRTSGSHGAHDIEVVDRNTKKVEYYLQVKSLKIKVFYFSSRPGAVDEWRRLYERWKDIGIPSYFCFVFRLGRGRKNKIMNIPVDNPEPPEKVICPES